MKIPTRTVVFTASAVLLLVLSLALLVYGVQFFTAPEVQVMLDGWAGRAAAGAWDRLAWTDYRAAETHAPPVENGSLSAAGTGREEARGPAASSAAPPPPSRSGPPNRLTPASSPAAALWASPPQPSPTARQAQHSYARRGPPEITRADGQLIIPALEIDAKAAQVDVREGLWDLEPLGDQIGWLHTTGARPGGELAMVFIGHVTLPPPGGPGPFLELHTLKPADEIFYRAGGKTYTYLVQGQRAVRPEAVENLYVKDGQKLLLVTCTGWNAASRRYDLRLLVEAVLVSVE